MDTIEKEQKAIKNNVVNIVIHICEIKNWQDQKITVIFRKQLYSMSWETLDKNRMHWRGSPTPFEEAIWIFGWFELVIRLQKE